MNRSQRGVIAYILEENRIPKRELKGKRIRFMDAGRWRLANGVEQSLELRSAF